MTFRESSVTGDKRRMLALFEVALWENHRFASQVLIARRLWRCRQNNTSKNPLLTRRASKNEADLAVIRACSG